MSEFEIYIIGVVFLVIIVPLSAIYSETKRIDCIPKSSVEVRKERAKIITKRNDIMGSLSYYFVTFELESCRIRIELEVDNKLFRQLIQGDKGILSFQEDKFINFERIINKQKSTVESRASIENNLSQYE